MLSCLVLTFPRLRKPFLQAISSADSLFSPRILTAQVLGCEALINSLQISVKQAITRHNGNASHVKKCILLDFLCAVPWVLTHAQYWHWAKVYYMTSTSSDWRYCVIIRLWICVSEMRLALAFCVLALSLVFLHAMAKHGYADSWAVEISGGEEKAKELAAKHGFTFRGQVSETAFNITLTDGSLWEMCNVKPLLRAHYRSVTWRTCTILSCLITEGNTRHTWHGLWKQKS